MAERFGNFEILRRLAAGGMAEVLLAKQRSLGGFERLVCLKRILPHLSTQEDFLKMFQDEARIAANLVHPNIAQIYDIGEQEERYYIAMEYVRGEDVRRIYNQEVARGQTIPRQMAALMVMGAAAGLDYAHRQTALDGSPLGIVHRDISPQNIVVTYDGHAKIVDFGVAKAAGKLNQTRSGVLKGKYSYMSPEQASGDPVDGRTDIFALGITLYETTTGVRLFKRENELETLHAVISCNVTPPSQLVPRYDKDFEAIILRALAYDADHRYQTAGELEQDLERYLLGHGYPTSASHLAAYMQDLFAEKLADEALFGGPPWHENATPNRHLPEQTKADRHPPQLLSDASKPSDGSRLPDPTDAAAEPSAAAGVSSDTFSAPAHSLAPEATGNDWPTRVDPLEQTHATQPTQPTQWPDEPTLAANAPPSQMAKDPDVPPFLPLGPAGQISAVQTERLEHTRDDFARPRRRSWQQFFTGVTIFGLVTGLAYGLLRSNMTQNEADDGSPTEHADAAPDKGHAGRHAEPVAEKVDAAPPREVLFAQERPARAPLGRAMLSVYAPTPMEIFLGNESLGTTPLENVIVEPGNLRLKMVNHADGAVARRHVRVAANARSDVRFPATQGQLFVTAKPWAWVQHGTRPAEEAPCHMNLFEGDYTFVLECPDGRRRTETVHIQSGQDAHIQIDCI